MNDSVTAQLIQAEARPTSTTESKSSSSSAAAASLQQPLAQHNDITLALAKKESTEHMHGMKELYAIMRQRPLQVKAYALNDPNAPPSNNSNITSNNSRNVKTIHFVRHGQGFHNLLADQAQASGRTWQQFYPRDKFNPYVMPELLDAPLTEKGRQQAILLQAKVAAWKASANDDDDDKTTPRLQLVVTSPNCRALQTSLLVFEQYLLLDGDGGGRNNSHDGGNSQAVVPFVAHEMVREEHGIHICDKRRSISRQRLEFPQVDFSLLQNDEDVLYRDDVRESKLELGNRIYDFLTWLSQRSEQNIGIVSHSSWLLALFNGVLDCSSSSSSSGGDGSSNDESVSSTLQAWFQTGEMRSVQLEFIMTTNRN